MIWLLLIYFWGVFAIVIDRLHTNKTDPFSIVLDGVDWIFLLVLALLWPILPFIQIAIWLGLKL